MEKIKSFWKCRGEYIFNIAVALAVGALAAFLTRTGMKSYSSLEKPPLSPPGWIFPLAWSILYTMMGISAGLVRRSGSREAGGAMSIYHAQLAANFFWPVIFFALSARLAAFFWLIILIGLVFYTAILFRRISTSAYRLLIPYILWLLFAAYLNIGTYILNG